MKYTPELTVKPHVRAVARMALHDAPADCGVPPNRADVQLRVATQAGAEPDQVPVLEQVRTALPVDVK